MKTQDEQKTLLARIQEHVGTWQGLTSDNLTILRLSGLSNACYRVKIKDGCNNEVQEPKTLLYRRFIQELTDRRIEQAVFKTKAEDSTGPKLYF